MEMFNELMLFIGKHSFFILLLYAVLMDTFLGVLRAVKEHKFNSCVGIDGAIGKVVLTIKKPACKHTDLEKFCGMKAGVSVWEPVNEEKN